MFCFCQSANYWSTNLRLLFQALPLTLRLTSASTSAITKIIVLKYILHVHATCPHWMSMLHVQAACSFCMFMLHVLPSCPCCLSLLQVHHTWFILHVNSACLRCTSILHVNTKCPCCMSMSPGLQIHAAYQSWAQLPLSVDKSVVRWSVRCPLIHWSTEQRLFFILKMSI